MTPRRRLLLLSLLAPLAACATSEPRPSFAPPDYSYLNQLRLKVNRIVIDADWTPGDVAHHVEFLAPYTPRAALKKMAEQRLIAGGGTGEARFTIEDASITSGPAGYLARAAVRVAVLDDSGNELAHITARAAAARPASGTAPDEVRADLYALVQALMRDMNVEFEYQVRRGLARWLEPTTPTAPPPPPVQSETLTAPGHP